MTDTALKSPASLKENGNPSPAGGTDRPILKQLGPGLVTGAADDDPSGIATYSQAGAQFGFNLLWLMLLTYPLKSAIQMISGRIGRVTGCGLAANLRAVWPNPLVLLLVGLLFVANTINIGANLSAMGASAELAMDCRACRSPSFSRPFPSCCRCSCPIIAMHPILNG